MLGNASTSDWRLFSCPEKGKKEHNDCFEESGRVWYFLAFSLCKESYYYCLLEKSQAPLLKTSGESLSLCLFPPACNVVCVHLVKVTKSNFLKYHFHGRTTLYHLNCWFSINEIFGLDYNAMCVYGLLMPVSGSYGGNIYIYMLQALQLCGMTTLNTSYWN